MSNTREVLVHSRRRTVHELRADGTTRCGNGLNRPDDYVQIERTVFELELEVAAIRDEKPAGGSGE